MGSTLRSGKTVGLYDNTMGPSNRHAVRRAPVRCDAEFLQQVATIGATDVDKGYDLWWSEMQALHPWASRFDDQERRHRFRKALEFCCKRNAGKPPRKHACFLTAALVFYEEGRGGGKPTARQ